MDVGSGAWGVDGEGGGGWVGFVVYEEGVGCDGGGSLFGHVDIIVMLGVFGRC